MIFVLWILVVLTLALCGFGIFNVLEAWWKGSYRGDRHKPKTLEKWLFGDAFTPPSPASLCVFVPLFMLMVFFFALLGSSIQEDSDKEFREKYGREPTEEERKIWKAIGQ